MVRACMMASCAMVEKACGGGGHGGLRVVGGRCVFEGGRVGGRAAAGQAAAAAVRGEAAARRSVVQTAADSSAESLSHIRSVLHWRFSYAINSCPPGGAPPPPPPRRERRFAFFRWAHRPVPPSKAKLASAPGSGPHTGRLFCVCLAVRFWTPASLNAPLSLCLYPHLAKGVGLAVGLHRAKVDVLVHPLQPLVLADELDDLFNFGFVLVWFGLVLGYCV